MGSSRFDVVCSYCALPKISSVLLYNTALHQDEKYMIKGDIARKRFSAIESKRLTLVSLINEGYGINVGG